MAHKNSAFRSSRSYDETDIRVRPSKGSRPRTRDRPDHKDALFGLVVTRDRGRWGIVLDDTDPNDSENQSPIVCMRAREMGRTAIVVGDRVGVVGDTTGNPGTLARIVKLEPRSSVLRRTADDTDPYERVVVANANQLLIVTALADPPPRAGFVERALIAAWSGNIEPIICLTKSDLHDEQDFIEETSALGVRIILGGIDDPVEPVLETIHDHTSALIGQSGVGKSTLVNRLIPEAQRTTGDVSTVGKGRHTSTQSVAFAVPGGGWVIDTPGIRSFGLAHVDPDTIIAHFPDLYEATAQCPRGCTHLGPPADPECGLDQLPEGAAKRRADAIRKLLVALRSNDEWELGELRDS